MASNKSSVKQGQSSGANERVDSSLVHVEISYHRHSDSDSLQLELKDLLRDCFQTVAEHWGGKLFSWDRHGGAFMFPVEDRQSYDNCCLAAIQMLEMVPSLNQDLRSSRAPGCGVEVRIVCDCGAVASDPETTNIPDFANNLAKHARDVTGENWVTITHPIYGQLSPQARPRFESWKQSRELQAKLYRASHLHDGSNVQGLDAASPARVDTTPQVAAAEVSAPKKRAPRRSTPTRRRRFAGILGPWQVAVVGLVALLVVEFFAARAFFAGGRVPANAAVTDWSEPTHSPEWTTWRNQVHEILSSPLLTEETLAEALRVKRPEVRTPPAAALRHDQAIGDVLQSYPRVRTLLETRLGIYAEFLGTGYSNPVNAPDYEGASLHEYLIPNLPDNDPRIWMRRIKLETVVEARQKTMKALVEEDIAGDDSKQPLKQAIVTHAEAGDKETVMVRFAILDEKKQYKNTLGNPKRERVFACDLAEVWKLKVRDAADRSGYTFGKGDTLFIWTFMPASKREAVLATWGAVLEHLPEWMEEAQQRP